MPRSRRVLFTLSTIGAVAGASIAVSPVAMAADASASPSASLAPGCVAEYDPSVDYFPDKAEILDATGFDVAYHPNYKVVTVDAADSGFAYQETLVLVQCGTPAPELTGDLAGAYVVQVPAMTVAANDDGPITMLSEIGLGDDIVAMGGGGIYDEGLRARFEAGDIAAIGYGFSGPPDYEILADLDPDVVFQIGFSAEETDELQRARDLGIPSVGTYFWSEQTPLGKAEWVKYHALFLNAEAAAESFYDDVRSAYLDLRDLAATAPDRQTIFWLTPGGDGNFYTEGGGWPDAMLADANTENVFPTAASPFAVAQETVVDVAADADLWLMGAASAGDLGSAPVDAFRAWQDDATWNYFKRVNVANDAYDYYEGAVVHPEVLLADIVALAHPELLPDHEFVHLQKVTR